MKEKKIVTLVTASVVMLFTATIFWWQVYTPDYNFAKQLPGADNRPEGSARKTDSIVVGEFFMRYDEFSTVLTGKWSCFRGPDANNILQPTDKINLSEKEFPIQWSFTTGEGHAAPVIHNGLVYVLDYDEKLSSDMLRCFSLESGKEIWRRWYRVPMKRNHGFSRTAPYVTDKYIITLGPQGHIMCCDPVSGDMKWSLDVQKRYQTEVPFWYAGQCPRIDNDILVIAPAGGETLMTGLDCQTGETVWQTPNTIAFKMSHSSVIPMTILGKRTYVYAGIGGVCGVSAEKGDQGTLLWSVDKWKPSVIAPSPLQLSSNTIFLAAGYGAGSGVLKISNNGGKWNASITEQYKPMDGIASEQQTPILYNNMMIGVMPKDGGGLRGKLVYYSPSDLHHAVWSSGADERFGLGPYMVIDNKLFILKDDGELYIYEIGTKSMKLLKKQRIMDGVDAWGPMAYADGRLIVRDAHGVYCLKIN